MTLPVTIGKIASLGRKDFALPEDAYLFIFSFDFNSTLTRKNPKAVIDAFLNAFPRVYQDNVGLVIKASHVDENNKQWKEIELLSQSDKRIHIVNKTLRRTEILALYQCCDCYVSLHRAEGFGRGLAESLLLDMQLITVNFSGNLDFCSAARVGLVDYETTPVDYGEYFHADGQLWAEPNISHAAEQMREIMENPKQVDETSNCFNPEVVGKIYADRLFELRAVFNMV